MPIIEISGLRKSFKGRKGKKGSGPIEAVKGIDLTVERGEIFGFLGPNGAGKSTTLKMLSTLLAPDAGKAVIAGYDLLAAPAKVRTRIGYVSQAGGADRTATGREDLVLQAQLFGMNGLQARTRAGELIDALELAPFADRFSKTYSGGQRRKLDVALGMVHRPEVLFLDEPSTGLDPVSRAQLWGQIRKLKGLGTTVFITTHYMDEADALCDRIAIIDKGRIVAAGSPAELKRGISGDILSLTVNHVENAVGIARETLESLPFVREMSVEGSCLTLVVAHGGEALPVVLKLLEGRAVGVADISLSRPTLDDVFLRVTGHSLSDGEPAGGEAAGPAPGTAAPGKTRSRNTTGKDSAELPAAAKE